MSNDPDSQGSTTVDESESSLAQARAEAAGLSKERDKYRKAAEQLARQCAKFKMVAERERAELIEEHDAFIAELTVDHDKLIHQAVHERDEARDLVNEAVTTRDGVAQAAKRVVRQRTVARRELGGVALERDVALRDAARATKQLADAKKEIDRLRRELVAMEILGKPAVSERPPSPSPQGQHAAAEEVIGPDGRDRVSSNPPLAGLRLPDKAK